MVHGGDRRNGEPLGLANDGSGIRSDRDIMGRLSPISKRINPEKIIPSHGERPPIYGPGETMKTKKYWTHRIAPPQHKKYEEKKTNKMGTSITMVKSEPGKTLTMGTKDARKCYG